MAGQVSKEELGVVLMQAMQAQKNLRPQRDRLLQLRRRMQQQQRSPGGGDDDAAWLKELASDLFKVYFIGIEAGARMLASCLELAAKDGARIDFNLAFAVIPDERLYEVLVAQRLPARPTTQAEAFSRVETTFNAVKLAQEHHIPRCIELLVGVRPPNHTGEPPRHNSMVGYADDTVAAAYEHVTKIGIPSLAKAALAAAAEGKAARKAAGKSPQAKSSIDVDQALTYLHRACSLLSLAVSHMDLAVAVLSGFLDPEEVTSLNDFTDKVVYISEDGPYPSD